MSGSKALAILAFVGLVLSAQAADYRFIGRRTVPGNDIDCGKKDYNGKAQPYCKICSGVAAVADACDNNPDCKGFDMEGGYCGYLKAATGKGKTVYTEGFSHYCKVDSGNNCEGGFIVQTRADVNGKDVTCNTKDSKGQSLPYCQVQGSPFEVAAACAANPECKAFTTTTSYGGYLKNAAGPTTYTEGAVTYVKG